MSYQNFGFLNSLQKFLVEQRSAKDSEKRIALEKYIIENVQTSFNDYIKRQGPNSVESEEEGGIEIVYLRAFGPIEIPVTVQDLENEFEDFDAKAIKTIIDELSNASIKMERDEKGNLIGFWISLVEILKENYDDEHIRVDVFVDEGTGKISFGVDEREQLFQKELD